MAEAEEDRRRLLANIENLEREKRQVEAENARIIEENRSLLEQLDGLNKAVAESDAHAKSLAAALECREAELRKVTMSAARAAELEVQLAQMEAEQSRLQETLQVAQEDSKSAVQRWKKAECTLRDLHDQVDRIEKEAREERERHHELIQRMERRRAVERELDSAAGRLKGAAAAQELGRNQGNPNVVSRFVRDILQDNANLQMGIIELREMLESSNQEVQNLRDQILSHQPLTSTGEIDEREPRPSSITLNNELESKESRRVSQEFHIHHHYHTPAISVGSKKEKSTIFRRSKKRRSLGATTVMHSASTSQASRKFSHQHQSSISSTSTILSQTSVSIPPAAASRRWSLQSPAADSSLASSPQSGYRASSIFDRVERGCESSQPTSPESTAVSSPVMASRHKNVPFDVPFRPLDGLERTERVGDDSMHLAYDYFGDQTNYAELDRMPLQSVIPEEMEDSSSQYAESVPDRLSQDPTTSSLHRTVPAYADGNLTRASFPLQAWISIRPVGALRESATIFNPVCPFALHAASYRLRRSSSHHRPSFQPVRSRRIENHQNPPSIPPGSSSLPLQADTAPRMQHLLCPQTVARPSPLSLPTGRRR